MAIPDKVTIGCYDYEVNQTYDLIIVDHQACNGSIEYENKIIKIRAGMSEQQKEQTFWHEVVHGIIHYRNFNMKVADDETCVDELAVGLYGMMKSNGLLPGQK